MTGTRSLQLGLVAATWFAALCAYPRLPDMMPIHWGLHGQPDRHAPRLIGAWLLPLIATPLAALFARLTARVASARGPGMARTIDLVALASLALLLEVTVLTLLAASGAAIELVPLLFESVALFLVVLGNTMGKLPRNGLAGVRTPWSLRDDENWLLTHRFAGRLFVLGGGAVFVSALAGATPLTLTVLTVVTGLLPAVYSYILAHRRKP